MKLLAILAISLPIYAQSYQFGRLSTAWHYEYRHGEYAQSETECAVPSQVSVESGNMVLTTIAQAFTCGDFNVNGTVRTTAASWPYTTGEVQWDTFSFLYGKMTFRSKYPDPATKLWPSHWMLATNCQIPSKFSADTISACPSFNAAGYNEIDIIECLGSCSFNIYSEGTSQTCGLPAWDTNWHTWVMNWTVSTVTLSLDGTQRCSLTNSPSVAMFLLIYIQTGGVAGTPVNSLLPDSLSMDYIKVQDANGKLIFYDDFTAPLVPSLLRPISRMARFAGAGVLNGGTTVGGVKAAGGARTTQ